MVAEQKKSGGLSGITFAYHLGAPFTDEGQLTWSLRKDAGALFSKGIFIRRPREYRELLTKTLNRLDGAAARAEDQEKILRVMTRGQPARRIIFSNPRFLGVPAWIFYTGVFYHNAANKAAGLRNLFPDNACEFHIGISNPAVFIPQVFFDQTAKTYEHFMHGVSPDAVRWSDVIARIRAACPDVPINVWCNEDTPVIWGEVLRRVAGLPDNEPLSGELDVLGRLLPAEGVEQLRAFLSDHPGMNRSQRQKVMFAFMEKLANEEEIELEFDLPGWSQELIERLAVTYDLDMEIISEMDGVTLIEP